MSQSAIADDSSSRSSASLIPTKAPSGGKPIRDGGSRELLALALPLVVSQSFMTVQVFVDTILLSWHDQREMAASFPAVMWFWLPFGLLQVTAGYVSTFVAQYTGAGRPERVGPAVWQGIHFAVMAGLLVSADGPRRAALDRAWRAYRGLASPGGHLSAVPLLRGAADAGHGRGQRVLLRPRADLDRAGHRGRRHRALTSPSPWS